MYSSNRPEYVLHREMNVSTKIEKYTIYIQEKIHQFVVIIFEISITDILC